MKSRKWHRTGQGAIPARCSPWPAGCTGAAEHRWILSPDSKHRKGHPCQPSKLEQNRHCVNREKV